MEIPVINRISDFETGITSLQNPTFLSQIFALSGIEKIHQAYSFWKWGALILALVASFTTIINRIKILIIRIQNHHLVASPPLLSKQEDYDYDSETNTSCSSSLSEDEEEDEQPASSSQSWRSVDEDFSVRGSGHYIDDQWQNGNVGLRRRRNSIVDLFSWPDLTNGKNVVKLWDNIGLGLGLNLNYYDEPKNVISIFDMNKDQNICSIIDAKQADATVSTSSSSLAVILSAEDNVLGVWDTRVGSRLPEIMAEWKPKWGKIVGVNGGGGGGLDKVYVRDDITGGLTVGDIRKVRSPLVNVTEADVDTWWDADAVLVTDESS